MPARQQCEIALWMIGLFDLALGSLNSLGPKGEKTDHIRIKERNQINLLRSSLCQITVTLAGKYSPFTVF